MSDENKPADLLTQWTETWRSMAGASTELGAAGSKSVLPFILARATESKSGIGAGNELADAIERMAQWPRLADVVTSTASSGHLFRPTEMQKKLAAYNAVASRPWMKAAEKYQAAAGTGDKEPFPVKIGVRCWDRGTALANDELLANQRTDEFLLVQRELLQAATEFRARQIEVSETVSKIMGLPTQSDFDDVTRQLTELRREVRTLTRRSYGARRVCGWPSARSGTSDRGDRPRQARRDCIHEQARAYPSGSGGFSEMADKMANGCKTAVRDQWMKMSTWAPRPRSW